MGETAGWSRWGRWLLLGLGWQVLGLAVTLALSLPLANFHVLIHRLILGSAVTNGVALLGGAFLVVYWRFWHGPLRFPALRVLTVFAGLVGSVLLSSYGAVQAGAEFCRLDGYQVNRWHLTLVSANAIVLVGVALTCGLVFAHERLSTRLAREVQEHERLERVQLETQLAALQSKVNPHFLFNTLNTIVDLVRSDPEKAEKLVLSLSDIYRRVLALPETAGVSLGDELALVEHYLSIEQVRMGARLHYAIDVPEELRAITVPPLSIEILAENAVRHGLAPRKEGGQVRISAQAEGDRVRVEVTDDGVGSDGRVRGTGFGLLSVRQRLDLLFGRRGRLDVGPASGGGTRAVMEVPRGH